MGYLVETRKNSAIVMTIGVGLSTFNVFIQKNSYNAQNHDGGAMEIFYLTFCFTLQGLALFLIFIPMLIGKIKFSFRLLQLNLFTPFANLVFSSFLALTCMMVCISSLDLYSYYWSTSE